MRALLLAAAALAVAVPALADDPASSPFDTAASGAQRVRKLDRMVWALTATCEQGDDLARRQCRILRDSAATRMRGTTILVDVDGAVEIGAWDAGGKASPITVRGCAACGGIVVDGTKWFVVANKAAPKISGQKIEAAVLYETARPFANDALAKSWTTTAGPRLRTQLLIKVPTDEKKAVWNRDGLQGLAVEVTGYRVWDQCDGSIIGASPEAASGPIDRKTCGSSADSGKGKPDDTATAEPVYAQLSKEQILGSLRPAVDEAKACFDTFSVAGDAKVKITIGGDGNVAAVEQSGDFVGTDTGKCIDAAIKKAVFPKSKKAKTTISYPVTLR